MAFLPFLSQAALLSFIHGMAASCLHDRGDGGGAELAILSCGVRGHENKRRRTGRAASLGSSGRTREHESARPHGAAEQTRRSRPKARALPPALRSCSPVKDSWPVLPFRDAFAVFDMLSAPQRVDIHSECAFCSSCAGGRVQLPIHQSPGTLQSAPTLARRNPHRHRRPNM